MVLQVLVDKNSPEKVGTYHFPKKAPGNSDQYKLEEYLSESQFSYLNQETIRFIYKNISDKDVEKVLRKEKPCDATVDIVDLLPKDGVLYVQQGEMGITHVEDECIKYIGSSDATTCHLLIIRDTTSGVSGVAHIDSVNTSHLNAFISKIKNLASKKKLATADQPKGNTIHQSDQCDLAQPEFKPLDLYVVGGYQDERNMSSDLSIELLKYIMESQERFLLKIFAVGSLNTTRVTAEVSENSHNAPILYGAAIEIASGQVIPARFPYRGPDETLRHLRLSFCGRKDTFSDPYNHETGEIVVPAFSVNPNIENLTYYMRLPDKTFLQFMSTSPKVEPPYFVENQKKIFRTAIQNPNMYKDIFPGRCNRVWKLHKEKGWVLTNTYKIIDQEDTEECQHSYCDKEISAV